MKRSASSGRTVGRKAALPKGRQTKTRSGTVQVAAAGNVHKLAKRGVAGGRRRKAAAPDAERGFELTRFDEITGLSAVTDLTGQGVQSDSVPPGGAERQTVEVVGAGKDARLMPSALRQLPNYSEEEIHALVIPKRTLARRLADREPLTIEETDKAARLARIDRLAVRVFGEASKAHRWLRKPKASLKGETPLAYLGTEAGARVVEEMLNQIDHGVLA